MTTPSVPAALVEDIDDARDVPGAFAIVSHRKAGTSGMDFICPCGCGRQGYLPFKPEPSPSWTWDGNRERPTLSPSVQQVGGCRWHGWLRAGQWVTC